jgi:CheY-like chemotaxis protein
MPADSNLKILVAEDNRMILSLVCEMLTTMAYDVQGANDGLEALRRFEREHFDLVLTDIQMPNMDGWELARRVKSLSPAMHVIAMTGMAPKEVPYPLGENGPDRILFKPLNLDELEDAMASALGARQREIA